MDVPSRVLKTSPGAWKFLMEMLRKKFHDVEMDVISGGLETSPGALKFLMEMFLLIVTGSS
jgi:hypothetical protein